VDGDKNAMTAAPRPLLSVSDGVFLVAGMVIGVGIFKLPGLVAANAASPTHFVLAWIIGGIACLCGALVYAELASRYPETGGEYLFLRRGLGEGAAFVFAWSRMTVIQTSAIAAVAFVFGEYATQLVPLGPASAAVWAAIGVAVLTALNLVGTLQSKTLQKVMEVLLILALAAIAIGGIVVGGAPAQAAQGSGGGAISLMMIFVLYTFGGWNEGAYLAGEVRDAPSVWSGAYRRPACCRRAPAGNWGYYQALGSATSGIETIAVGDAGNGRRQGGDPRGDRGVRLSVHHNERGYLHRRAHQLGARAGLPPVRAARELARERLHARQRAAAATRDHAGPDLGRLHYARRVRAMVAYGLPVFWAFLLLTGITLFIFRARGDNAPSFRVPLYPVIPLAFLAMCAFMLWASFDYVANSPYGPKFGVLVGAGLAVMLVGIPLYFLARRK
jgi:amino acid transporter